MNPDRAIAGEEDEQQGEWQRAGSSVVRRGPGLQELGTDSPRGNTRIPTSFTLSNFL